jgi:hypothetical protein
MKLTKDDLLALAEKQKTVCAGCKKYKRTGLVVCWDCWKYETPHPYKYWQGTFEEWIKAMHSTAGEVEG